ncbi:flagellar hook-length control protein FliK [Methylocella sp.]|uniref:flagellar hook-length control protein FliK n=1 Tax=Methylocella sp. TaxID=1978226 RepID=UPI0037831074
MTTVAASAAGAGLRGVDGASARTTKDESAADRRGAAPFDALIAELGDRAARNAEAYNGAGTAERTVRVAGLADLQAALGRVSGEAAQGEGAQAGDAPLAAHGRGAVVARTAVREPASGDAAQASGGGPPVPARSTGQAEKVGLLHGRTRPAEAERARLSGAPRQALDEDETRRAADDPGMAHREMAARTVAELSALGASPVSAAAAAIPLANPAQPAQGSAPAPPAAASAGVGALRQPPGESSASSSVAVGKAARAPEQRRASSIEVKAVVLDRRTHLPPAGATLKDALSISEAIAAEASTMTGGPSVPAPAPAAAEQAAPASPAQQRPGAYGVARSLDLQLEPEALGRITIRLRLSAGRLDVEIEAAQADAAKLIHDDGAQLARKLRGSGYVVDHLVVKTLEGAAPALQAGTASTHAQDSRHADFAQTGGEAPGGDASAGERRRRPSGEEQAGAAQRRGGDGAAGGDLYL